MIRRAAVQDIPRLVAMGGRFVASSSYRGRMANDAAAQERLMRWLIDKEDGALFVAEQGGRVTGMIGVAAYMHPWAGEWIAGELFWWVEPEARGPGLALLRCAERWAKAKGCVRMQMIAPNERVGRAYEALGYAELETSYQKDL